MEIRRPRRLSSTTAMRCAGILAFILAAACSSPATFRQSTSPGAEPLDLSRKAVIILASDIREETSLNKDITHMGDVYFRRVDETYRTRQPSDYDFGIEYSLAADWAALSGEDKNRAPKVLIVEPGTYILEKVNVGDGPTTFEPALDPDSGAVRFGAFNVEAGEVVNLGRLVIHMHYYQRYFSARVEDNSTEAKEALSEIQPDLVPKMSTRLIDVAEKFPFVSR